LSASACASKASLLRTHRGDGAGGSPLLRPTWPPFQQSAKHRRPLGKRTANPAASRVPSLVLAATSDVRNAHSAVYASTGSSAGERCKSIAKPLAVRSGGCGPSSSFFITIQSTRRAQLRQLGRLRLGAWPRSTPTPRRNLFNRVLAGRLPPLESCGESRHSRLPEPLV